MNLLSKLASSKERQSMFCFYKLKHARRKLRIMALKEQMRNDVIKILVKPVSWCRLTCLFLVPLETVK